MSEALTQATPGTSVAGTLADPVIWSSRLGRRLKNQRQILSIASQLMKAIESNPPSTRCLQPLAH